MPKEQLYKKYAKYYDKVYSGKKYDEEVEFVISAIGSKNLPNLQTASATGACI